MKNVSIPQIAVVSTIDIQSLLTFYTLPLSYFVSTFRADDCDWRPSLFSLIAVCHFFELRLFYPNVIANDDFGSLLIALYFETHIALQFTLHIQCHNCQIKPQTRMFIR